MANIDHTDRTTTLTTWSGPGTDGARAVAVPNSANSAQLGQGPAQVAHGLTDALLVLDEGEAHVAIAARTEAHPGRGGHIGLGDEVLGEFERAHLAVGLGDGSPDEHGALGRDQMPPDPVEPVTERVPPGAV